MAFPGSTGRFRIETRTRAEPYEPATPHVVGELDGILGDVTAVGAPDGGKAGAQKWAARLSFDGNHPLEQGMVAVDHDGNDWTIDTVTTRSAFGAARTTCTVTRTAGQVTA